MNGNIFCHKTHFFLNTFDVFDKNFFRKNQSVPLGFTGQKGVLKAIIIRKNHVLALQ